MKISKKEKPFKKNSNCKTFFDKTVSSKGNNEISKEKSNEKLIENLSYETSNLNDEQKLKRLFYLYSNSDKNINKHSLIRLLTDAGVVDKFLNLNYLDLVFSIQNENKNKSTFFNFSSFCNILLKISEIKFPQEYIVNSSRSFEKLLNIYLFPCLDKILYPNKLYFFDEKINMILLDQSLRELFINSSNMLKTLYKKFFPWEKLAIADSKKKDLSERAFIKFLKEFFILPDFIDEERVKGLFVETFKKSNLFKRVFNLDSDLSDSFSYYHFTMGLYFIALVSNFGDQKIIDEFNNFYLIIQKINEEFKKSKSVYDLNNQTFFDEELDKSKEEYNSRTIRIENSLNIRDHQKNVENLFMEENFPCDNKFDIFLTKIMHKYKEVLIKIYKYYCSASDYKNYFFMNFSTFLKIMRDSGIIDKISNEKNIPNKSYFEKNSNDKKREKDNFVDYYQVHQLFSEISSETNKNSKILANKFMTNKENYLYFETRHNRFNTGKRSFSKENQISSNKIINYQDFVKILICLSNKIFNPKFSHLKICNKLMLIENVQINTSEEQTLENLFENLLKVYFTSLSLKINSQISKQDSEYQIMYNMLKDEKVFEFMNLFKPTVNLIFTQFSKNKEFLFFEEFLKMCQEYDIFPALIQINRLYTLFYHFVELIDKKIMLGIENVNISKDKFFILLIFCAFESKVLKSFIPIEKITFLFERFVQSEGLKNCAKLSNSLNFISEFNNKLSKFKQFRFT